MPELPVSVAQLAALARLDVDETDEAALEDDLRRLLSLAWVLLSSHAESSGGPIDSPPGDDHEEP